MTAPLDQWFEPLNSERLNWAPVRTLTEALQDENAERTGMFATVEHPEYGTFKTAPPPSKMSGHAMIGDKRAPDLVVDTAQLLAEAGVDGETIALLLASAN